MPPQKTVRFGENKPKFLQKAGLTPESQAKYSAVSSLPSDILQEASSRLGWAGLVFAATFFLAYFGVHLVLVGRGTLEVPGLLDRPVQSSVATISVILGLAVFFLSRYLSLAPQLMLDLGLIFEVVGAFGISLSQFWGWSPNWSGLLSTGYLGIPWECVWILIFPLLAPNTPGKVTLASLGAASTGPLTLLLSSASGASSLQLSLFSVFGYFLFSTYLCAGIAIVIARQVYRFGAQLKEAREVGSYQLTRKLGEGGMGEVWVGEHRMLARPAAIKLIRPALMGLGQESGENILRRFTREAQATAALGSPHSVDLYDFGVTDEGAFYYVMELLSGLNLEALVKSFGPVAPGRAVWLLRQACHSLADAHEQGLIHRDVKPANIFSCHIGREYDFVKVLDFGLVKWNRDYGEDETSLTREGAAPGTPAFMAPEMIRGEGEIDGRVDIYALGCVGYWLLTGKPVFRGKNALDVVAQHLHNQPLAPSQRSELIIPEDLEEVILACLSKRPQQRPGSAQELSELLLTCQRTSSWSQNQSANWWRKHLPDIDSAHRTLQGPGERYS